MFRKLLLLIACVLGGILLPPVTAAAAEPASACALPGRTGWTDEGRATNYGLFARPLGVVRAVMLFVDFPDAPASAAPPGFQTTQPYYDVLVPGARQWYATGSFGRLDLQVTRVDRWYRMSQPADSYGFQRGITFSTHAAYIREAVRLADPDVNFAQYDLVYVVPPRNAAAITFSPAFIDSSHRAIPADGAAVDLAATFGQDMWRWGFKVLNHETGHLFGLPDLYAYSGSPAHRFVGGWDLMGLISGPAPDYFGWHKWKNGWLDDAQVGCVSQPGSTATVQLTPVERAGGTKIAVVRTGTTTAYVVENRRAVLNDSAMCGSGTLIYRVDSAIATGTGPVVVVDATPDGGGTAPCTNLDMATFGPGQVYTAAGVRIVVLSRSGETDTVEIRRI